MSVFDKLRSLLMPRRALSNPGAELIYVLLPEDIDPDERFARYEDPLDVELQLTGLGAVSGGGSQLGDERPDGTPSVEFCGVDVDAVDLGAARELLRNHLPGLGCPPGTALQYRESGVPLEDVFDGAVWALAQPGERLHPGFGV